MTHARYVVDTSNSPHSKLRTVSLSEVTLDGGFWAEKQQINRQHSLEHGYAMLEESGALDNFRITIGQKQGEFRGMRFQDSDVYKWVEAAAYELAQHPDAGLEKLVNTCIDLIEAAQDVNGYINTYYQINKPPETRWTRVDHDHELYCAGHLIQAAVAHHRATGNDRLLNIARRFGEHILTVFGKGKREEAPGHPEVEMALVELYRDTGDHRYLGMAQFFLDERGKGTMKGWPGSTPSYYQDRVPVRENDRVEGHAVRALYLTSGMADVFMETGEQALFDSMMRQWHDLVCRKMYITGGAGARHDGEAFGEPYELPDESSYCETCAAIASVFWNWRLLLITGEGRYADLIERTLLNGFLSGVSTDGRQFFYVNPLLVRGAHQRQSWYPCACCPPNVMRLIASINSYLATVDSSGLQIHQYAQASIQTGDMGIRMETNYPWEGRISIQITASASREWELKLRLPEWCAQASLTVNGQAQVMKADSGYMGLRRAWKAGDTVELNLPFAPRLIEAHPHVSSLTSSVAIECGPLVYCLEATDMQEPTHLLDVRIDPTQPLKFAWDSNLLGGTTVVEATGYVPDMQPWQEHLYIPYGTNGGKADQPTPLRLIPYHLWANRGPTPMRVWIPVRSA